MTSLPWGVLTLGRFLLRAFCTGGVLTPTASVLGNSTHHNNTTQTNADGHADHNSKYIAPLCIQALKSCLQLCRFCIKIRNMLYFNNFRNFIAHIDKPILTIDQH